MQQSCVTFYIKQMPLKFDAVFFLHVYFFVTHFNKWLNSTMLLFSQQ